MNADPALTKSPDKEKSLRVSISHSRNTPHHPKGFVRTDLGVQAQPAQSAQMCVKIAADSFSNVAIPHSAANPKGFT